MIGSRLINTNSVEFVLGQEYYGYGDPSQPNISEKASLTAPYATAVTRTQKTNVTQIFQEVVGISDAKLSNMGTLSGINIAGQSANPMSELDFQIGVKMQKIANDIEYTFINGKHHKANSDDEANQTRGLVEAIETNVLDLGGRAITLWDIAEALHMIRTANAPGNGLIFFCDTTTRLQLNADAIANNLTIVPAARNVNGINLDRVVTPLGEIDIYTGEYLPAGTALILNIGAIRPVGQNVPGKGNFYREELAKVGAGQRYMIFGQIGLDYGYEFFHAKITGIANIFVRPESGIKVYTTSPISTVETIATLKGATLDKTTVAAADSATVSVKGVEYDVVPNTSATLTYLWQIRAKTGTVWTDLTDAYTGYNTATLTVHAADAEKHYRCKVTATGTATGTVYSNECTVEASE